jgi:hypothetical protein
MASSLHCEHTSAPEVDSITGLLGSDDGRTTTTFPAFPPLITIAFCGVAIADPAGADEFWQPTTENKASIVAAANEIRFACMEDLLRGWFFMRLDN